MRTDTSTPHTTPTVDRRATPSHPAADAVLIAPDRTTVYLASAVAAELERMTPGSVLQVDLDDGDQRADFAEWCLTGGRRIVNPSAHYLDTRVLVAA